MLTDYKRNIDCTCTVLLVIRFDDELGRGAVGGWPSEALHLLQQEEEVKNVLHVISNH